MTYITIDQMPISSPIFLPIDQEAANVRPQGMSQRNVLIVDDSQVLREKLTEMLSDVPGLVVVGQAEGVADAQRAIDDLEPGLVILDLQLRDGNGLEVLRETRRNHPTMKFVVFTNQPELQYRQRCGTVLTIFVPSTDAKARGNRRDIGCERN
jgi:CheY-like chemotaxis protein